MTADCPRCAALTRERDEALGVREGMVSAVQKVIELRDKCDSLSRDLAQARQALRLTVGALEIWENAVGEINVWPLECRKALIAAREALVERGTEQTDLGGARGARSGGGSE